MRQSLMVSYLKNLKPRDLHNHAMLIQLAIYTLLFLAITTEVIYVDQSFGSFFLFLFLFFIPFGYVHFRTLKKLQYSYWTFNFFQFVFVLNGIIEYSFEEQYFLLFQMFLLSFVLIIGNSYILSYPFFFPRVRWWEYDFRYKGDLKIHVAMDDKEVPGRLTDLRRNSGCVVLFNDLSIGSKIKVKAMALDDTKYLTAEIITKREYSIGRGITYGVKFEDSALEKQKQIENLTSFWKTKKNAKVRNKFS